MGVVLPTHPPERCFEESGGHPQTPARGETPSALPFLVVDVVALAEIRKRTYWEAGESQVTPVYLNEYKF
jgi:hypothetical protein